MKNTSIVSRVVLKCVLREDEGVVYFCINSTSTSISSVILKRVL